MPDGRLERTRRAYEKELPELPRAHFLNVAVGRDGHLVLATPTAHPNWNTIEAEQHSDDWAV